jgi:hypothetical protein
MATIRKGAALPDSGPMMDPQGNFAPQWGSWFTLTDTTASAMRQSGPTADRPVSVLWIGRQFFDTDLGFPVWVSAVNPTVWVDATGALV